MHHPPSGRRRRGADDGFTLLELLLVLVIMPMVVGAIVDLILTTVRNDSVVSGRLSDTQAEQVLSAYFSADVESATSVTTDRDWPGTCGTPGQTLTGGYTIAGGNPDLTMDIGTTSVVTYWLVPGGEPDGQGAVVRTFCPSGAGPATDSESADLGTASALTFFDVVVSPSSADVSGGMVDADSIQTVAIAVGHGANDAQQSPGLQVDLVAAPRT